LQKKAKDDKNAQDPASPGLNSTTTNFVPAAKAGQKKFYEIQGH